MENNLARASIMVMDCGSSDLCWACVMCQWKVSNYRWLTSNLALQGGVPEPDHPVSKAHKFFKASELSAFSRAYLHVHTASFYTSSPASFTSSTSPSLIHLPFISSKTLILLFLWDLFLLLLTLHTTYDLNRKTSTVSMCKVAPTRLFLVDMDTHSLRT